MVFLISWQVTVGTKTCKHVFQLFLENLLFIHPYSSKSLLSPNVQTNIKLKLASAVEAKPSVEALTELTMTQYPRIAVKVPTV